MDNSERDAAPGAGDIRRDAEDPVAVAQEFVENGAHYLHVVDLDGAREGTQENIGALRSLAAQAFAQSRFRAPWYAPEASGRFYAQWIENAVKGTFDNQCLIFRDERRAIRGFVSLRELNASDARIGLLAGRGAGAELMQAAVRWAYTRGHSTLRVATQAGNTAALQRYIHSGANVVSTAYWLYR